MMTNKALNGCQNRCAGLDVTPRSKNIGSFGTNQSLSHTILRIIETEHHSTQRV